MARNIEFGIDSDHIIVAHGQCVHVVHMLCTPAGHTDNRPLGSFCRSMYPGDSRAGLVPFLAHQVFGDTYKWLLYMDDDTIFFPDAVQRLLEDFDPDLPYFITGVNCKII